jgi:hypothetical protein
MHASSLVIVGLVAICLCCAQSANAQQGNLTYSFNIGYTQCFSCKLGTFVDAEGSGTCQACGTGYFQDSNGSSICKECPAGARSLLDLLRVCAFHQFVCCVFRNCVRVMIDAGTYNPSIGSSSENSCQLCRPGTYSNQTAQPTSASCMFCPAGTYSFYSGVTNKAQCLQCPAGSYSLQVCVFKLLMPG